MKVMNYLIRPCALSFREIATPRLYNRADLISKSDQNNLEEEEGKMLARVSSLLSARSNLWSIRILSTGRFSFQTTKAMDALLPQLHENALIEFNFSADERNFFPTLEEQHLQVSRQENLQNIQLCTHHIPSLIVFLEKTREPPYCLPKSITWFNSEISMGCLGHIAMRCCCR